MISKNVLAGFISVRLWHSNAGQNYICPADFCAMLGVPYASSGQILTPLLQIELILSIGHSPTWFPVVLTELEQLELALLLIKDSANVNGRDELRRTLGLGDCGCRSNRCRERISSLTGGGN